MSTSNGHGAVGIDGVSVYVPRLYLDLSGEWALARAAAQGTDAATLTQKLTKGIGVRRMAVPDAHEDSATMAAMAARKLIDELGIDLENVGYLVVGTETTVDQSKSIGAYVLGMLSQYYRVPLSHVGCPQIQFACIGATYALESAVALVQSGNLRGRTAIVIATDIARYPRGDAAECTQGAGAVAMHVCASPRLLELQGLHWPTVTVDERDFFRPNWSSEAVVDGRYSVDVYLSCLDRALRASLQREPRGTIGCLLESDHFLFHTPFPKMAEYAGARLYRRLEALRRHASLAPPGDAAHEREADRDALKCDGFGAWFERHCVPALRYMGDVGNVYSGALYLAFATLVESLAGRGAPSRRLTFFSYGSGASARLFTGTLTPGFEQVARVARLSSDLIDLDGTPASGRRRSLRLAEYEGLHAKRQSEETLEVGASVVPPADEFALLRYGTERSEQRIDVGYRYYDYVPGTDAGSRAR